MTSFVLFQVLFLSFVMVKAVPVSNSAIEFQNNFEKIVEFSQISPRAGMEAIMATESENDTCNGNQADKAIQSFLIRAMVNYTTWLGDGNNAERDPPTVINLNTTGLPSDELVNLTNQHVANHSTSTFILPLAYSTVSENYLAVMRLSLSLQNDLLVTFGGDYNVTGSFNVTPSNDTGSFNVTPSHEIAFSGKGNWMLKGIYRAESIAYDNYSLDKDEYIDLSKANIAFSYKISWKELEFQGLKFHSDTELEDPWMPKLKEGLAQLYGHHLNNNLTHDEFQEHNLPRRLLNKYLQETLSSKKLVDILSDWEPVPCLGVNILASSWVVAVTLAAYFCGV